MVLITGATGLVGSHLALHLTENEAAITAIYRKESHIQKTKQVFDYYKKPELFEKISWIKADILDIPSLEIAFQDITTVYHCAALISFDPKDELRLRKTNIEGTANVVNFCLAKNVKRFCYVSSIAALGNKLPLEKTYTETTEWNLEKAHSDYAISKYGAEMEVFRAQQEGLSTIIVNPGVVLGPDLWETGSGEIFRKVKNGLLFYTKGKTGFVSVMDLTKCMVQLTNTAISGVRFIIISENLSYKNLLFDIATAFGVKKPRFYVPKTLTTLAYKIDWIAANLFGQKRKLSKFMAKSLHSRDLYENKKIKATLNFEFQKIKDVIIDLTENN
jgi:dihydroflavonol-4-reductase